jgi:hypothetical protein
MPAASARRRSLGLIGLAAAVSMALPAHAGQYQPGAEFRGYPSGEIISGFLGTDLGNHYYGSASLSYNFAQRGSNGKHDDENGGGIGGGVTVDKYFRPGQLGWFLGGRAELFGLSIDYRNPGVSGTSDILVFQPTVRGGYAWAFDHGHYGLQLGLSFGGEINVHTRGEAVGDGAIVLGGVAFTFKP